MGAHKLALKVQYPPLHVQTFEYSRSNKNRMQALLLKHEENAQSSLCGGLFRPLAKRIQQKVPGVDLPLQAFPQDNVDAAHNTSTTVK